MTNYSPQKAQGSDNLRTAAPQDSQSNSTKIVLSFGGSRPAAGGVSLTPVKASQEIAQDVSSSPHSSSGDDENSEDDLQSSGEIVVVNPAEINEEAEELEDSNDEDAPKDDSEEILISSRPQSDDEDANRILLQN